MEKQAKKPREILVDTYVAQSDYDLIVRIKQLMQTYGQFTCAKNTMNNDGTWEISVPRKSRPAPKDEPVRYA